MEKLKKMLHGGKDKEEEDHGEGSHLSRAIRAGDTNPAAAEGYGAHSTAPLHEQSASSQAGGASGFEKQGAMRQVLPNADRYDNDAYGHAQRGADTDTTGSSYGAGNHALRPGLPRDSLSNASIKSGVTGHEPKSRLTDPLTSGLAMAGDTNKPLPISPVTRMIEARGPGGGFTGTSLPDRSVGSTTGAHHDGSDSGLAAAAATAALSARQHESDPTRYDTTGSSRTFPLSSGSGGVNDPAEGDRRAQPIMGSERTTGTTGYESESIPWTGAHEHHGHGHTYEGDPCAPGEGGAAGGAPHSGPHLTATANRLDPHVGERASGGFGASTGLGVGTGLPQAAASDSGYATSTATTGLSDISSQSHSRDTAVAGAGAAASGREYRQGPAGPTQEDPASKTLGPHKSNLMNVIDPRVQPEPSKMRSDGDDTRRDVAGYGVSPYSSRGLDPRLDSTGGAAGRGTGSTFPGSTAGEERKSSHGLLGLFHRDKTAGQEDIGSDAAAQRHQRVEEAAGTGAVGAAGAGYAEHRHDRHERNRLHKDPPADHPAALAGAPGGFSQHAGTDGPIGTADTVSGIRGTNASEASPATQEGIVTEPHTGLPMNVGKYGSGHGGTDQGPIPGYRRESEAFDENARLGTGMSGAPSHPTEGVVGPDWEAIRKANTPY